MKTDDAIRNRKTIKVLGNTEQPLAVTANLHEVVREMIDLAGNAPYHYACHKIHREEGRPGSIVPWRFHVLLAAECRKLLQWIMDHEIEAGKIARMLSTADALVQVTWLPDVNDQDNGLPFEPSVRNVEHIAAASAAIQNLLLLATARGIGNYWSSGGVLREEKIASLLQIPPEEQPLGSVFLFPSDKKEGVEEVPGKLRDLRGNADDWSRWIEIQR